MPPNRASQNYLSRALLCAPLALIACRDPSVSSDRWNSLGSADAGGISPDAVGSGSGSGSGSGTDGPLGQCFAAEQEIVLPETGSVMDGVVDDFNNDCSNPDSIDCLLAPYAATPGDPDCIREPEEPDEPDGTDAYPCRPWATLREADDGSVYGTLYSECPSSSSPTLTYSGSSGSASVPLAYQGMTQDEATHHIWDIDGPEPFNPTFRINVEVGGNSYTLVPDLTGEACAAGGTLGPTILGIGCSVDLFPDGYVPEPVVIETIAGGI